MPKDQLLAGRPTIAAGAGRVTSLSELVPNRTGYRSNMLDLVRRIRDYNADASKAVSNVLRLANSGWAVEAYRPDGETPYPEAQVYVEALTGFVGREYGGGLDVLINMLHLTAATQGALALEVELTPDLQVYDFVAINPWRVDFRRDEAHHWVPGIASMGSFEPLNTLQFKYIPVDPEPGDPHGRSPFWAALDIVFFQMEVLRDLKAAAHFAGYPRIDISVAMEAVVNTMLKLRPDLLSPDKADEQRKYLDGVLGDITDMIDDLEPDDAFVHYDSVTSQYTVPSGRTIDIKELTATIDAQIVSGLKQLPILLGRNEGATTTHATVQWQVYVQELRNFQKSSQHMLEWAFGLALRVAGMQGVVKLNYEKIRATDRLQEAQAEAVETGTMIQQVNQGWITNDEAALEMTGHDAKGAPLVYQAPDAAQTNAIKGRLAGSRQTGESVDWLPIWQQNLHHQAEANFWATYRQQVRRAWERSNA